MFIVSLLFKKPSGSFKFSSLRTQVEIQPAERETIFSDELRPSDPRNVGPCGGFSTQYACMCDYHGVPYRFVVLFYSFSYSGCVHSMRLCVLR